MAYLRTITKAQVIEFYKVRNNFGIVVIDTFSFYVASGPRVSPGVMA